MTIPIILLTVAVAIALALSVYNAYNNRLIVKTISEYAMAVRRMDLIDKILAERLNELEIRDEVVLSSTQQIVEAHEDSSRDIHIMAQRFAMFKEETSGFMRAVSKILKQRSSEGDTFSTKKLGTDKPN